MESKTISIPAEAFLQPNFSIGQRILDDNGASGRYEIIVIEETANRQASKQQFHVDFIHPNDPIQPLI